ncbi:MAG TPA: ATP-binding protein [Iamia sp.]|nr:ATP-binding protein [Iamia sp.]
MSGSRSVLLRTAEDVTPSARRLVSSLRDIGYDFTTALADIVDNSVAAGASRVDVDIVFDGPHSYVSITDDGDGMTASGLVEALRFGTRRGYEVNALGRYGLGLKTASISQARRLTVLTRQAPALRRIAGRTLDLDHIERTDRWEITPVPSASVADDLRTRLDGGPGTVVIWEILDRVLPMRRPEGGWARRRLEGMANRASDYLGMVFHRFIDGGVARPDPLVITVNGEKVRPWNPFAPGEEHRTELVPDRFEIAEDDESGTVRLRRYVLPSREQFSSPTEFDRLAGPRKWNRQQGLYIYRANRMIQGGGWCGLRAPDEHTKYARAALDFDTDLDGLFRINVAKMRVSIPSELRPLLERPVNELCARADAAYRRDAERRSPRSEPVSTTTPADASVVGASLVSAALDAGEQEALTRVMEAVRTRFPDVATSLGW